jgi:ribose 5-phosphate isomerase B
MQIFIGTDHAGYELKEELKKYLSELGLGYEVADVGAKEYEKDDDYPEYSRAVAEAVASHYGSFGVVLGGSGQGEAMCANRVPGARAAVFYGQVTPDEPINIEGEHSSDTFEIIKLAREHNDANILSIGVRFTTEDEAKFAIELFLKTPFSGEERHKRRIKNLEPSH